MLLSEQSIKSLRKNDLIKYAIETTKLANKINVNDQYEFVKNPKIIVKVDDKHIKESKTFQVTFIDKDKQTKTYNITFKIMSSDKLKISSHNFNEIINIDNPLAVLINSEGLTKSVMVYIFTKFIQIEDEVCFNFSI